jgi:hypothetical protein
LCVYDNAVKLRFAVAGVHVSTCDAPGGCG